jgi:hypothetical protein
VLFVFFVVTPAENQGPGFLDLDLDLDLITSRRWG